MRHESSVSSISWIPSEAVRGMGKLAFEAGFTHYDDPPPDRIDDLEDLEELRAADRFRFANDLTAWVEVDGGRIADHGYAGGGLVGNTRVRLGGAGTVFQGVSLPVVQQPPEVLGDDAVRFVQTVGGRTGLPAPRRVNRPPFVQYKAPTVWTTLALTMAVDGSSTWEVVGASAFPRHWVYDDDGALVAKSGVTDFKEWWRHAFGAHTPWGDEDSPALVTAAETALERSLSSLVMQGADKPAIRKVKEGRTLVEEGDEGDEVFLLLDGVLAVEVGGQALAELGPGALLGERAVLEDGRRTSTLRALTACRVAVAPAATLDREALQEVSAGHRREEKDQ